MEKFGKGNIFNMNYTVRERLTAFTIALDFPNVRKEWLELFEMEYANAGELKSLIDDVVNDDASVYAGMQNGAIFHNLVGAKAADHIMDMVVFILYLWWKKNVMNDTSVASEFPEEI